MLLSFDILKYASSMQSSNYLINKSLELITTVIFKGNAYFTGPGSRGDVSRMLIFCNHSFSLFLEFISCYLKIWVSVPKTCLTFSVPVVTTKTMPNR